MLTLAVLFIVTGLVLVITSILGLAIQIIVPMAAFVIAAFCLIYLYKRFIKKKEE